MQDSVSVRTPAKINLNLDILGKRNDGYHFIRTIMQTVTLFDEITVTPNGKGEVHIYCDYPDIPCNKDNLCYKAAIEFFKHIGCVVNGIDIKIRKSIPPQAGLAGGSSDAAGMLVALNELMQTNLSKDELCDIGAKVGADVAFLINGATSLAEGVGDLLNPLPSLPECYIVIAKPDINISTPEAFKKYDNIDTPTESQHDDMIAALAMGDIHKISELLFNVLEYASNNNEIVRLKEEMLSYGALGALMTGSGSCVYGIFDKKKYAARCADELSEKYSFSEVVTPFHGGAEVID